MSRDARPRDPRVTSDPDADAFEYAEQRLTEWGLVSRSASERVGLPPDKSDLRRVIDRRRVFENNLREIKRADRLAAQDEDRRAKGQHPYSRKRRRGASQERYVTCPGCAHRFKPARECPHCGRDALTADGKSSASLILPSFELPGPVLEIETIVRGLPMWMQKTLRRVYLKRIPDAFIADDLKMRVAEASHRRRCAVQRVADILQERRKAKGRSSLTRAHDRA